MFNTRAMVEVGEVTSSTAARTPCPTHPIAVRALIATPVRPQVVMITHSLWWSRLSLDFGYCCGIIFTDNRSSIYLPSVCLFFVAIFGLCSSHNKHLDVHIYIFWSFTHDIFSDTRRSMPNLNKMRGGRVGNHPPASTNPAYGLSQVGQIFDHVK